MEKITVFADGASRGNPGLAGAGATICWDSQTHHLSVFLGTKTNNEAEYLAVLLVLRLLSGLLSSTPKNQSLMGSKVLFKLDSKLVVEQMSGRWKIKERRMKTLVDSCQQLAGELGLKLEFEHISRELNQQADWLANQAIDLATS